MLVIDQEMKSETWRSTKSQEDTNDKPEDAPVKLNLTWDTFKLPKIETLKEYWAHTTHVRLSQFDKQLPQSLVRARLAFSRNEGLVAFHCLPSVDRVGMPLIIPRKAFTDGLLPDDPNTDHWEDIQGLYWISLNATYGNRNNLHAFMVHVPDTDDFVPNPEVLHLWRCSTVTNRRLRLDELDPMLTAGLDAEEETNKIKQSQFRAEEAVRNVTKKSTEFKLKWEKLKRVPSEPATSEDPRDEGDESFRAGRVKPMERSPIKLRSRRGAGLVHMSGEDADSEQQS